MNERIKQLADQATSIVEMVSSSGFTSSYANFDREKFAELIVQECMREIRHKSFELLDIDFYPHYLERLKKHFGVEE